MASYIVHSGVKGRSGKKGAGLYYRYGELTEEGKRHYYGNDYGLRKHGAAESLVERKTTARQPMDEKPHKNNTFNEQAPKTSKVLNIKKVDTSKKEKKTYTDEEKKKMRDHKTKAFINLMGAGMSMASQAILSRFKNDPKNKKFYSVMSKVNTASILLNSISAYSHATEYDRMRNPEKYKT